MRTDFLCTFVFRVAPGPRVKLVSCKSALNPTVVYSSDCSKAVVPVLVLLFVALWFILRGDLFYVLCYFFMCFSVLLALPQYGGGVGVVDLFFFSADPVSVLVGVGVAICLHCISLNTEKHKNPVRIKAPNSVNE